MRRPPSPPPSPARGEGERRDRGGRGLSLHCDSPSLSFPHLPVIPVPSLSFPRSLFPTFVIGERESRGDAVHVYGMAAAILPSDVILPSSVIPPSSVILSEVENLAFWLRGHDAGGVGQRSEGGQFLPSPPPSPARGEGARRPPTASRFGWAGSGGWNIQKQRPLTPALSLKGRGS